MAPFLSNHIYMCICYIGYWLFKKIKKNLLNEVGFLKYSKQPLCLSESIMYHAGEGARVAGSVAI